MAKKIPITIAILFVIFTLQAQKYIPRLQNKTVFDSLSGAPLANKYGNVIAVKIVYDLGFDSLYYLSSKHYKNHYVFCHEELNYDDGYGNFLKRNYSDGSERKYLLGNINYFQGINKYVLDISPVDLMNVEQIISIHRLITQSSFMGKNVFFLINSPRLQQLKSELDGKIPLIEPSEIYKNLTFQAISKYSNNGILRIVEDIETVSEPINPTDIIILKNIPNYLPAVAGVIVTEFQTPLSHISILGLNRKIPICAYTSAFSDESIQHYIGKQVLFSVQQDSFLLEENKTEIKKEAKESIKLSADLSADTLVDIAFIHKELSEIIGSKAANFGELHKISQTADFKTPEGAFAIPFYFYYQHIKKTKAEKYIQKLVHKPTKNSKKTTKLLNKITQKIMTKPINPELIQMIDSKLKASNEYAKFRFRSSTNAEDIKGFSGAGLYKSKTVDINNPQKSIEKALKQVWVSLWSPQAYTERSYYGIDQSKVYMGILVHRSFPDEEVNGVALTKNIYRKNSNGFLVNAQVGDQSVVKPEPGVTCDQFLCFPSSSNPIYKDKIVVDVLTYSNLNNNKLVMTEQEIQHLADQLNIIKKHFTGPDINKWTYTRVGYDVEFKLDGASRQLYIKQIRPYND